MTPTRDEVDSQIRAALSIQQEKRDGHYRIWGEDHHAQTLNVHDALMLVLDWLAAQEKPAPVASPVPWEMRPTIERDKEVMATPPPAPLDEEGLVEKVAKAFCRNINNGDATAWNHYTQLSRAAIAAMREADGSYEQALRDEQDAHQITVDAENRERARAEAAERKLAVTVEALKGILGRAGLAYAVYMLIEKALREIENREGEADIRKDSESCAAAGQSAALCSSPSLPAELEAAIKATDETGEVIAFGSGNPIPMAVVNADYVESERAEWRKALAEKDAEIERLKRRSEAHGC